MDRTLRGLFSGIVAGIAMNIWNLTFRYFVHAKMFRLLDWVAVLAGGGKLADSGPKIGVNLVVQIIWDGTLGIIFAHLLTRITSRGLLIKSVVYSTMLWFFFATTARLFGLTPLTSVDDFTGRVINLLGAVLWGIVLGLMLKRLDKAPVKG